MNDSNKYKLGLALSGGFIKGFAHLGIVQALFEEGLKPNIISGVSAGALAGAFIADGYEPFKVVEIFQKQKFNQLTSLAMSVSGLLKMDEFVDFIKSHLSTNKIEKLKIPMVISASDLDHGISVQFRKGDLTKIISASCCMPILFSPVKIGGVNYVDGGVFKNLPVSPIREECRNVVAVNVSPINAAQYKKNVVSIGVRCYNYLFRANTVHDKEISDLLIEVKNLDVFSNTELEKASEIFDMGYKQGREQLKEILKVKGRYFND